MQTASPHIGEINCNNSAHLKMKIIGYESNDKYIVQFEDGSIRTDIHYASFKQGAVLSPAEKMAKTKGRIGETYRNAQNEVVKIVEYHNHHDVTVEWEDGTRREHLQYGHIKAGNCPRPENMKRPAAKRPQVDTYSTHRDSEYLRQTMTGNVYKLKVRETLVPVKVIKYFNAAKIEVELPTGERKCVSKARIIDAPIVPEQKLCVGERHQMNCGETLTIIAWHDCNHVDVQFDDGTVLTDVKAQAIWKHYVRNPNTTRNRLLNQAFTLKNGHVATIIKVRTAKNVDVQFEDGIILQHVNTCYLRNGVLCHPDAPKIGNSPSKPEVTILYYLQRLGFKKLKRGYWKRFHPDFGIMELDFFNEELMCGGEYDGGWNHNQEETTQHDYLKEKLCKQAGITIFRIREEGLNMDGFSKVFPCSVNKTNQEWKKLIQDIVDYINETYRTQYVVDVDVERDADEIDKLYAEFHPQCRVYATPIEDFSGTIVCSSILSACRKLNVSETIRDALNGKRLASCGYFWSDHPLSEEEYANLYTLWHQSHSTTHTHRQRLDLTGQKFGTEEFWVQALYETEPRRNAKGNIKDRRYVCQCKCGTEFTANVSSLRGGTTTSCGCRRLSRSM